MTTFKEYYIQEKKKRKKKQKKKTIIPAYMLSYGWPDGIEAGE